MKRTFIVIGVLSMFVLALAGVSLAANEKPVAKPKPLDVGDAVSDFSLPGLDGKSVSFYKDIKGKKDLAVIMFMTTACSACQGEIAAINDMLGKLGEKVGLYAVAVDIRGVDTVKPYAETYRYKATYLLDPKFSLPRAFGFSYTPSVAMIDKGGKLLFKKGGYAPGDEDMLQEKIMSYLKK
ncbi:MAG: TlpA family protein disulfide reductase [Deltaproteobacteria bacterium]|nr:TlpA family protein disulfide reductase [Deltaproteobacteria bacterium]